MKKIPLSLKVISLSLVGSMLYQAFFPTVAWALTSGPSQPEFSSFSTAGVNNLVNPFTGDFSYNIDLLSVPGFEGGYPVNLSYNAGPSMEEEASWVGLGWTLNTGAVNRTLRGLPDDFKGDEIIKQKSMKPNSTFMVGAGLPPSEVWGADLSKAVKYDFQSYFNNYSGFGYKLGLDIAAFNSLTFGERFAVTPTLGLSYDSQSGFSIKPKMALRKSLKDNELSAWGGDLSFNMNSRTGVDNISFVMDKYSRTKPKNDKKNNEKGKDKFSEWKAGGSGGASSSFAVGSTPQTVDFPMLGQSYAIDFKSGLSLGGVTLDFPIKVMYSRNGLRNKILSYKGYGYLHSEDVKKNNDERYLMDYSREKDLPTTKNSKVISIPVANNDIFNVNAQGLGGTVKAYRSDIGVYQNSPVKSRSYHLGAGVEFDPETPSGAKAGINLNFNYTESYSGPWKSDAWVMSSTFGFEGKDASLTGNQNESNDFYEPYYFKATGELTSDFETITSSTSVESDQPVRLDMRRVMGNGGLPIAALKNTVTNGNGERVHINNYTNKRSERVKRSTEYQFIENRFLANPENHADHHIGMIKAIQPTGKVYEFGDVLYNTSQKDASFSVGHNYKADEGGLVNYDPNDASTNNNIGKSESFNATILPPYVYSYLLTSVKTPGYVDVKADGLTDDDFGQYVKFDYSAESDYKWRAPYEQGKANYSPVSLSLNTDDMASYTYGVKKIKYLNQIETKTHIAEFVISDREDALPVSGEHGGKSTNSTKKQKLDKIKLFRKGKDYTNDATDKILLKTVHLEYTYDLCQGVSNNSNATVNDLYQGSNNAGGKLTLKKVYFTYGDDEDRASISKFSPYVFDYHEDEPLENPAYNRNAQDRWGNYNPTRFDGNTSGKNLRNLPYTYQGHTDESNKQIAGVWSLKEMLLPSGGKMHVEYEMDDYSHVQNKKATRMLRIIGAGASSTSVSESNLKGDKKYLFFDADSEEEVNAYFEDLDQLYFKVYIALKNIPGTKAAKEYSGNNAIEDNGLKHKAYDYVEGYATLAKNGSGNVVCGYNASANKGYVKIEYVNLNDSGHLGFKTHPFRKAGFQHIRIGRADLLSTFNPTSITGINGVSAITTFLNQYLAFYKGAAEIILGYNKIASISYCTSFKKDDQVHPSYVRVNNYKRKLGGGYRVSRIYINDEWETMNPNKAGYTSFAYGQEYIYSDAEGTSTGVASYEPMVGSEENALKSPMYYGPKEMFLSRKASQYVETPIGESFYPSPVVGYSKVISKSLSHDNVHRGADGIVVSEFHTAKDFPVIAKLTGLNQKVLNPPGIFIPFVGSISYNSFGYSQGFSVELNDMHGKPKATATYRHVPLKETDEHSTSSTVKEAFYDVLKGLESQNATSKVDYEYLVDGKYDENVTNQLANEVDVLVDGKLKKRTLGKSVEFYLAQRQNSTFSYADELPLPNIHVGPAYIVPAPARFISFSSSSYRDISTMKLISRNAILKKTIAYDGKSGTSTENLVYDPGNGQVLLSTVTNHFDDKVYSYSIPAKKDYPAFEAPYKNVGALIPGSMISGPNSVSMDDLPFRKGDVVKYYNKTASNPTYTDLWVIDKTVSTIKFVDGSGTAFSHTSHAGSNDMYLIYESGLKNYSVTSSGSIVSLTNPLTAAIPFQIGDYNQKFPTSGSQGFESKTCDDKTITLGVDGWGTNTLQFTSNGGYGISGQLTMTFDNIVQPGDDFVYQNDVLGVQGASGFNQATVEYADWVPKCYDVLNAQSITFADDVALEEEESIKQSLGNGYYSTFNTNATKNPYRYGRLGIYRPKETYVYRTDRKRELTNANQLETTNIRVNGEYETFNEYVHHSTTNPNWIEKAEATLYSPYGFELESKNALDIYSSALYGESNKLPIMVGANARYKEMAFESFEGYTSSSFPTGSTEVPHGHVFMSQGNSSGHSISSAASHTGDYSLKINNGKFTIDLNQGLQLVSTPAKPYFVSIWVKVEDEDLLPGSQSLVSFNGSTVGRYDVNKSTIDGWQLVEAKITPTTGNNLLEINSGTGVIYVDDIRIIPNDGSAQTYVYDDQMRLWSTLDAQHFATFYNYDEEGNLLQVKKETDKGIVTLQSGRIHSKQTTGL